MDREATVSVTVVANGPPPARIFEADPITANWPLAKTCTSRLLRLATLIDIQELRDEDPIDAHAIPIAVHELHVLQIHIAQDAPLQIDVRELALRQRYVAELRSSGSDVIEGAMRYVGIHHGQSFGLIVQFHGFLNGAGRLASRLTRGVTRGFGRRVRRNLGAVGSGRLYFQALCPAGGVAHSGPPRAFGRGILPVGEARAGKLGADDTDT
jgi:hypothetical protein